MSHERSCAPSSSARWLEPEASLALLSQGQNRNEEVRDFLEPVYDWFSEGFDTKDLKDAKALLEELAWPTQPDFLI
jgi:predicted ATPase